MTHDDFIAWCKQQDAVGKPDACGFAWSSWLLAVYNPDGSAARDNDNRQIFETQAEYQARRHRHQVPIGQTLELFA